MFRFWCVDRAIGNSNDGGWGTGLATQTGETFSYRGSMTAWHGTYENPSKGPINALFVPLIKVDGIRDITAWKLNLLIPILNVRF
jgi:hypothetical protein